MINSKPCLYLRQQKVQQFVEIIYEYKSNCLFNLIIHKTLKFHDCSITSWNKLKYSKSYNSMNNSKDTSFEFKPITLQIYFSNSPNKDSHHKLQQYHKLLKMKKMLVNTEQKMHNRINLFKKASNKLIKKKQMQYQIFNKIQNAKNHPFYSDKIESREDVRTVEGKRRKEQLKENIELDDHRITAQKIIQQRLQNARLIKQEKERFKTIIEERNKLDLQRKHNSANSIRIKRNNAKLVREQMENSKRQEFYKSINDKYEREREQFCQLERHLNELQIEQQHALRNWKNTMNILN